MNKFAKYIIVFILLAITIAFLIPIIIKYKTIDVDMVKKEEYDKIYRSMDSLKNEYFILELKLKESDKRTDTLEKIISNSMHINNIIIERKNENLRIINSNSLPELDSLMSTINIKAGSN